MILTNIMSATHIKGHLALVSLFDNPPLCNSIAKAAFSSFCLDAWLKDKFYQVLPMMFEVLWNLWFVKLFMCFEFDVDGCF